MNNYYDDDDDDDDENQHEHCNHLAPHSTFVYLNKLNSEHLKCREAQH